MSIKKVVTVAVSLAVLALSVMTVVGCSGDDGDDGLIDGRTPTEIDNNLGAGASGLVGDWTGADDEFSIGNNSAGFLSFKSSGDVCFADFKKVDNFWLEASECEGTTWRVDGNEIVLTFDYGYVNRTSFSMSGNTFTVSGCRDEDGEEICWTETYSRANMSSFRSGKTIRTSDPALNETAWKLGDSNLELYGVRFYLYPRSNYFDDNHDEYVWYTNGNSLFLIGAAETDCRTCTETYNGYTETWDCDCALISEETIEFQYTHVPGVSLRLRNTSRGIDDLWEYYSYDYYMSKRSSDTDRRAKSLFGIGRKSARNR